MSIETLTTRNMNLRSIILGLSDNVETLHKRVRWLEYIISKRA